MFGLIRKRITCLIFTRALGSFERRYVLVKEFRIEQPPKTGVQAAPDNRTAGL